MPVQNMGIIVEVFRGTERACGFSIRQCLQRLDPVAVQAALELRDGVVFTQVAHGHVGTLPHQVEGVFCYDAVGHVGAPGSVSCRGKL